MRIPFWIVPLAMMAACAQPPSAPAPAAPAAPKAPAAPSAPSFPLDALSAQEIEAAAKLIRAVPQFPGTGMFSTIVLKEPPKADVLAFTPGATFSRQAFAIVLDRRGNHTYEVVADLRANKIASWTEVKSVQPAILDGEYDELSKIVKRIQLAGRHAQAATSPILRRAGGWLGRRRWRRKSVRPH